MRRDGWLVLAALAMLLASPASSSAANIVPNGRFDTNLKSWDFSGTYASWSSDDAGASPNSGSAQLSYSKPGFTVLVSMGSACLPVEGGGSYEFGGAGRLILDSRVSASGSITLIWGDATCDHTFGRTDLKLLTKDWQTQLVTVTAPANAQGAEISLRLLRTSGGVGNKASVHFDNIVLQPVGETTTTIGGCSGTCGDPVTDDEAVSAQSITTADALFVLQAALGLQSCDLCVCDADGSGELTAADALLVLEAAVGGGSATLNCPL